MLNLVSKNTITQDQSYSIFRFIILASLKFTRLPASFQQLITPWSLSYIRKLFNLIYLHTLNLGFFSARFLNSKLIIPCQLDFTSSSYNKLVSIELDRFSENPFLFFKFDHDFTYLDDSVTQYAIAKLRALIHVMSSHFS